MSSWVLVFRDQCDAVMADFNAKASAGGETGAFKPVAFQIDPRDFAPGRAGAGF